MILIATGGLSLIAQSFLLTPTLLGSFLPSLNHTSTSFAFGAVLFALSVILFASSLSTQFAKNWLEWRTNVMLLTIQALTIIGIFLLVDGFGLREQQTGFLLSSLVTILTLYGMLSHTISTEETPPQAKENTSPSSMNLSLDPGTNIPALREQIESLTRQLTAEKHRSTQLTLLNELSQQLEAELDPPVAAQLAVNTLERAMDCSFVALLAPESGGQEYVVLASAGRMTSIIPPGYRQNAVRGVIGRTHRLKKTQMVHDTELDSDFTALEGETTLSIMNVPLLQHGHIKGILSIYSEKKYAFSSLDAAIAEGVASELMRAWERSSYRQRLTELIQAGISLTTLLDPQAAVQEVAVIARKTLEARFVFVTLLDQQGNFSRTAFAGEAPKLFETLNINPLDEAIMHAALNATKPFRVRDLRKYSNAKKIEIDHPNLRSVLAIPIRLHRLSIGAILAFGKQEGVFFSENDESLADLNVLTGSRIDRKFLAVSGTTQHIEYHLDVVPIECGRDPDRRTEHGG